MHKLIHLLSACLLSGTLFSQHPEADKIETAKGPLTIQPIYHGSIVFTWDGKTIYVDPYHGAEGYKGMPDPDIILLTDIHPDHLDLQTLAAIHTLKAIIVAPQAVKDQLPDDLKNKTVMVPNGKSTTLLEIPITAVPMYNLPANPQAMHPKGRGNGYLLRLGDKTIYISGDTGDTQEMRALKGVDVAFVCMNMPYTMEVTQAADAVLEFQPKIVYPYHYRGQNGLSDVEKFKKLVDKGKAGIEVRLRNWYEEP